MSEKKYKLNLEIISDTEQGVADAMHSAMTHMMDGNNRQDTTYEDGTALSFTLKHGAPRGMLEFIRTVTRDDEAQRLHEAALEESLKNHTYLGTGVPVHLWRGLIGYVAKGSPVGDFLTACIENNLGEAVANADDKSLVALPSVHSWLYNSTPSMCHGSYDSMNVWMEAHRIVKEERR